MKLPTKSVQTTEINHQLAGDRVRQVRKKAGISLRKLATEMGVSAPFLSDLERGRRNWSEKNYAQALKILHA